MKNLQRYGIMVGMCAICLGWSSARAAIISLTNDHVNEIVALLPDDNFDNSFNFTTYHNAPNIQRTLVLLSNASLLNALQTALGPSASYHINSATLTVGSDTDPYAPTVTVAGHLVLQSYDPTQVTWNSRQTGTPWAAGGLSDGVDYVSVAATTGSPTPSHPTTETDFTGLGPVVQNWLDNATPNFGLLFLAPAGGDYTGYQNVVWTLDAVPEPGTAMLLAIGGLLLFRRRAASYGGQGRRKSNA